MKKIGRWLLLFSVIGFVGYKGSVWMIRHTIGNPVIVVKTDEIFSLSTTDIIEQFCLKNFSPWSAEWVIALKKQISLIERVASTRDGNRVTISVSGMPLIFRVNDDCAIDSVGQVHAIDQINQEIFAKLTPIRVIKKGDIFEPEFKLFIQNIPAFIKDDCLISWHSPYEIYLKPIIGDNIVIIRYDKIPTQEQLYIGKHLAQENAVKKKEMRSIDFRFTDQIVLGIREIVF